PSPSFSSTFFCSPSSPSRDLHSFPTRRSSDLNRIPRLIFVAPPIGEGSDRNVVSCQFVGDLVRLESMMERTDFVSELLRDLHLRDRKSTRLNSSHVSISYAVFCLKKKKADPYA